MRTGCENENAALIMLHGIMSPRELELGSRGNPPVHRAPQWVTGLGTRQRELGIGCTRGTERVFALPDSLARAVDEGQMLVRGGSVLGADQPTGQGLGQLALGVDIERIVVGAQASQQCALGRSLHHFRQAARWGHGTGTQQHACERNCASKP
jgi:hypothetical protein